MTVINQPITQSVFWQVRMTEERERERGRREPKSVFVRMQKIDIRGEEGTTMSPDSGALHRCSVAREHRIWSHWLQGTLHSECMSWQKKKEKEKKGWRRQRGNSAGRQNNNNNDGGGGCLVIFFFFSAATPCRPGQAGTQQRGGWMASVARWGMLLSSCSTATSIWLQ